MIYLDMDGVLADFIGGVAKAFKRPGLYAEWPPGVWRCEEALDVVTDSFWSKIETNTRFWHDLEPYPWAANLVQWCLQYDEVRILTHPHDSEDCYQGKKAWHKRHFPDVPLITVSQSEDKQLLCGSGEALLIDDSDMNVSQWPGNKILFPRPWNSRHELSELAYEQAILEVDQTYNGAVVAAADCVPGGDADRHELVEN